MALFRPTILSVSATYLSWMSHIIISNIWNKHIKKADRKKKKKQVAK